PGPAGVPEPGPAGAPGPAGVPESVAEALLHATREALANVAAHAGTGEAWVTAGPVRDGLVTDGLVTDGLVTDGLVTDGLVTDGPARSGPAVQVRIRDAGRGFDPGLIGPSRLGVRMSISERVADCGGSASVRSAPGEGTEVCLRWPAPAAMVRAAAVASPAAVAPPPAVVPAPGPLAAAGSAAHTEVPPC
ncbi:MAG: sensor histidine kinase, partial [Streptosporangiales bacterium]